MWPTLPRILAVQVTGPLRDHDCPLPTRARARAASMGSTPQLREGVLSKTDASPQYGKHWGRLSRPLTSFLRLTPGPSKLQGVLGFQQNLSAHLKVRRSLGKSLTCSETRSINRAAVLTDWGKGDKVQEVSSEQWLLFLTFKPLL